MIHHHHQPSLEGHREERRIGLEEDREVHRTGLDRVAGRIDPVQAAGHTDPVGVADRIDLVRVVDRTDLGRAADHTAPGRAGAAGHTDRPVAAGRTVHLGVSGHIGSGPVEVDPVVHLG